MQIQDTLPPRVAVSCAHCGREFTVWRAKIIAGRGLTCSRSCAAHTRRRGTVAERFWKKVDRSGGPAACWLWTAAKNDLGYGLFGLGPESGGRHERASRVAWALTNGPIPPGLWVLHNCPTGDDPRCVNPSHLFLGTSQDNHADMVAKQRHTIGERNSHAKLTGEQVDAIRAEYVRGKVLQRDIAAHYGVSVPMVSEIVNRRHWKHR